MTRLIAAAALLALLAAAAIGSVAAQGEVALKVPVASRNGVGGLRLGDSIAQLKAAKLIGGARKGCELAPGQRVAPLKPPLTGSAIFYPKDRLVAIEITGGAMTAAGVGVGDGVGAARKAYPQATYDRPGHVQPFPQGFLWIGGRAQPRMTLVIEPGSRRVEAIDIPSPNFCE
jgi:hypothetical protein